MHRLYPSVVAPLIEALEPRRIVETGAGTGRLTRRVLDAASAREAVVHAVDPAVRLDPRLLEAAGPRLRVHEQRGIGVIGDLGPVDLMLLDGDPNWYSVHAELTIAMRVAERAGAPAPLAVVHGVHWPFGRRDGYYEPAAIPPADLHEHCDLGLVPGQRAPSPRGLRLAPFCATRDFDPRSGVLTAVEDVVAASDLDWTVVEVPGFHGAAVLAEARLLERRPALAAVLEELSSASFLGRQARRAETARLTAELEHQAIATEQPTEADPAPAAVSEPALASPPEPDAGASPELEAERAALFADAAEHRARREAFEWRAERLGEDLAEQARRSDELSAERDAERSAAVEARVRLESASAELAKQLKVSAGLGRRVTQLENDLRSRRSELADMIERERLAQGRLVHSEDVMQALKAERDRLREEVAGLEVALSASEGRIEEIAAHLDRARRAAPARRRRRRRAIARALGFGRNAPADSLEQAWAVAEDVLSRPTAGDDRALPGPDQDVKAGTGSRYRAHSR